MGPCGLEPPVAAKDRTVDEILAQLGSRSHGVVTRRELLAAGVTRHEIQQRIDTGGLITIHRGVFRAAVKACGPGSLLAGFAAANLLHLLKRRPSLPEVLTARHRRPDGVVVRRCRSIDRRDVTEWRGIPVTTVPRTVVDLAALLDAPDLARVSHEGVVIHGIKPGGVERVLARRHNWPGAGELRRVLRGDEPVMLSKLESSFIAAVRRARLPLPQTNRLADGRYVDCRWPGARLTVELDGYRAHATRHAWELDRQREREARTRGDEFRRYTWRDVVEDPEPMLADLRALFSRQLPLAS